MAMQEAGTALQCPNCAAPANLKSLEQNTSQYIKCRFCKHVYPLQQSQADAQQRELELRAWVQEQISSISLASASADLATRSFLFNKNLYPNLKRDVDRFLEDVESAPEMPLIPFKPLVSFPDYQPHPALVSLGRGNHQDLKRLTTRLSAPQIQGFAAQGNDQLVLKTLQFRIDNLIYYANIASLLQVGDPSDLPIALQNVQALQKEYQEFAQQVTDEKYRSYLLTLNARLDGAVILLGVLTTTLTEGKVFSPDAALAELERSSNLYKKAEQQANACTYDPLYTIPLQQGIHKDMMVIQITTAMIKCYAVIQRSRPVEFRAFFDNTMQYVYALTAVRSFPQLLGLIDSLQRMLAARAGLTPLPVINEWSWLQPVVDGNIRKGMFGGGETVGTVNRHLHPYWIATLNYAEKQGRIFKSGSESTGLILADATAVNVPVVGYLLANDPLLPIIGQGTQMYNLLDKQIMAAPALISREQAEQAMRQFASAHGTELGATNVRMIDLIYLPAAYVNYIGKNQQRTVLVGRVNFVNQDMGNVLAQTHDFLQQYGA
jgi:hypothetical protein